MPITQKKTREFWETDDWKKFFAPETPSKGMPGYTLPEFDVGEMQQKAIAPIQRAYREEIPRIESRLSKRKMGRSGAWFRKELKALEKYGTDVGVTAADYPLRVEALRLEAARHGLTAEQFEKTLAFQKEQYRGDIGKWLREQEYRETTTERELDLEAEKLGMTREQFQVRMDWEKEQFGRTLETEDRRFDRRMELEWRQMGLQEQEIADKKEMFYEQLKQYESQFSRELTFKEVQSLRDRDLELSRQGLTQQEIDNEMNRFNAELSWQQEHFERTFTFEETKWMNEYALALEESNLSRDQFSESVRQFDEALQESKYLDRRKLDFQEKMADLNYALDQRRISDQEHRTQVMELQVEYERDLQWGWTDEEGNYHSGNMEMEKRKNEMMENQIFGYWDDGFEPSKFEGDKYQRSKWWNILHDPENADQPQTWKDYMLERVEKLGEWARDSEGNKIYSEEWNDYMSEHYHRGVLDLREWSMQLDALLGLRGASNY